MDKRPCVHESICPYGTKPRVGMWTRVGNIEFWGTDCIAYIDCPRRHWTEKQWKGNKSK